MVASVGLPHGLSEDCPKKEVSRTPSGIYDAREASCPPRAAMALAPATRLGPTRHLRPSGPGGWVRFTAPGTRGSTARSRPRCCPRSGQRPRAPAPLRARGPGHQRHQPPQRDRGLRRRQHQRTCLRGTHEPPGGARRRVHGWLDDRSRPAPRLGGGADVVTSSSGVTRGYPLLQLRERCLQRRDQGREVLLDRVPEYVVVNHVVSVSDPMTCGDGFTPRDFPEASLSLGADSGSRFPNDLHQSGQGEL